MVVVQQPPYHIEKTIERMKMLMPVYNIIMSSIMANGSFGVKIANMVDMQVVLTRGFNNSIMFVESMAVIVSAGKNNLYREESNNSNKRAGRCQDWDLG